MTLQQRGTQRAAQPATQLVPHGCDIVVETRSGLMRAEFVATERRSGTLKVCADSGRDYHFPAERCTVVPVDVPDPIAHAMHVAASYEWEQDGDTLRCAHPTDPDRTYWLTRDGAEWSCTCRAFEYQSALRPGYQCKHIRAAILREGK